MFQSCPQTVIRTSSQKRQMSLPSPRQLKWQQYELRHFSILESIRLQIGSGDRDMRTKTSLTLPNWMQSSG
jgi:hypothetical protein